MDLACSDTRVAVGQNKPRARSADSRAREFNMRYAHFHRSMTMRINDGVTRAVRAAKLRPGTLVPVEAIHDLPRLDVT
jgi:hypothetical protein